MGQGKKKKKNNYPEFEVGYFEIGRKLLAHETWGMRQTERGDDKCGKINCGCGWPIMLH